MAFQIKSFVSIVASMVNRLRSTTTGFNDFNVGAKSRVLVEAVAQEQDELYRQILNAVVEALPVSVFNSFNFTALPASPAAGLYRVTIVQQAAPVPIPAGTIFRRSDLQASYVSIASTNVPSTGTFVDVSVVCTVAGALGNLAAGDAATISPTPTGFVSAVNLAPLADGLDAESDSARGIRFRAYIATLTRAIGPALVYGACLAQILNADGSVLEQIKSAVVIEPYLTDPSQTPAYVQIYVYNGVGGTSAAVVSRARLIIAGYIDPVTGLKVAGYKAAGVVTDVFAAIEQPLNVVGVLGINVGQTRATLVAIANSTVATYIAGLDIGAPAVLSELVRLVMEIPGVNNITFSAPVADTMPIGSVKLTAGLMAVV